MADDTQTDMITRLQTDMKAAMKGGDKARLGVIRMLLADARSAVDEGKGTADKAVEQYHKRLVKSRDEYDKLGEADRVKDIDAEIAIVDNYVPKKASAEETHVLVDDFLAGHPEMGPGDVGKATGLFMKQHGANVDPRAANTRLKEVLSAR